MSTSKHIHDIVNTQPMGDVEKYFDSINNIFSANSGNNDYRMTAQDSYGISVPVRGSQFTRFKLTDPSLDVIDISQGYLNLKCRMKYDFCIKAPNLVFSKANTEPDYVHTTHARNACYFFLGFKSGAQIIKSYNVYSNGKPTACKQLRSIYEQAIVYNCKAKEERAGRPGMYSPHKDVLKMRDCVCGCYIQQPANIRGETTSNLEMELDICIQIDDLLPFSAMTYFPQFACGELELEIMCEIERNMVWCQVPYEEVLAARPFRLDAQIKLGEEQAGYYSNVVERIATKDSVMPVINALETGSDIRSIKAKNIIDTRFHQCGDYARCYIGLNNTQGDVGKYDINNSTGNWQKSPNFVGNVASGTIPVTKKDGVENTDSATTSAFTVSGLSTATIAAGLANDGAGFNLQKIFYADTMGENLATQFHDCYVTLKPHDLEIYEAKSYIFGFNLKDTAKQNCMKLFENQGNLTIPAQWIEHMNPAQTVNVSSVKITTTMPLWQCGQVIMTFPNSPHQLTVSRNPYLKAIRCQVGNKLIPDKNMTTIDKAHAEMTLTALGFDTIFSAPKSLLIALAAKNEKAEYFYPHHDDDSDYMFICDMERNGNSVYHDGISGDNVPILFDAEFINETSNPHYYAYDAEKGANNHHDLRKQGINIFAVSDAYWVFGRDGGQFEKDHRALAITRQKEAL